MTFADLESKHPKHADVYRLVDRAGRGIAEAAERLGLSRDTVRNRLLVARRLIRGSKPRYFDHAEAVERLDAKLVANGRCPRCSLLLPHAGCTPTSAAELAECRTGLGDVYPEGAW